MVVAREKFSNGWEAELKRSFRRGYPPKGNIFNSNLWKHYQQVYVDWCLIVEKIEAIWDTPLSSSSFFSNLEVDEIIRNATFLEEDWRTDLAQFFNIYYSKYCYPEKLMLVFLAYYKNRDEVDEQVFALPLMYLVEVATIKRQEVLG